MFKRRLCAFILAASLISSCSPHVYGEEINNEKTDIAAQEDSMKFGISSILQNYVQRELNLEVYSGYVTGIKYIFSDRELTNCIGTLNLNDKIEYSVESDDILRIWYCGSLAFVSNSSVGDSPVASQSYYVPYAKMKSWMPYTAITSTSSPQYKLQQVSYTGNYGIRMTEGRYCVALGTYFGASIGQYFDLVLQNGTVIPCVLADVKADAHTDSNNTITIANNCMSEFLIDYNSLKYEIKRDGTVSSACDEWNSPVATIVLYEKFAQY